MDNKNKGEMNMGTYYIPRNYKGETRILYIFTVKSLITTVIGAAVGLIFYCLFSLLMLPKVGIGFLIFFGLLGFGLGAFKIPTIAGLPVTKKIGGEPVSEIILRYIKFKKNRKIYTYTEEED